MKRSEINAIIGASKDFLAWMNFKLPPFAHWSPEDWRGKGEECREIIDCQLGWDITDFGGGDYASLGLFLFTIRNGDPALIDSGEGKSYAEKIMIVQEDQVTPTHTHLQKMEDIINRGGGVLRIQLWDSTCDGKLADTPLEVSLDGVRRTVPAAGIVDLAPGESITLRPGHFHKFWGAPGQGAIMVGEVSRVNDDHADNCFVEPLGRFPEIEEDEPPLHLLVGDYPSYYQA